MSISPELLRQLDAAVKASFQASRDEYFLKLTLATLAVVVGVAIEEIEYFLSWRSVRRFIPIKVLLPPHRLDTIARRVSKLGWLLIVIGVAGEGLYEERVSRADAWLQEFNGIMAASQEAEITQLGDVAAKARMDANAAGTAAEAAQTASAKAMAESNKASAVSATARDLAQDARKEADAFETRLASAELKADEAEAREVEAAEKLNRLKYNRSLMRVSDLTAELSIFRGTEYTFSSVFSDDESVQLLRSIDAALQSAGWKRVPSPPPLPGVPFISIPSNGESLSVPSNLLAGIQIFVNAPESAFSNIGAASFTQTLPNSPSRLSIFPPLLSSPVKPKATAPKPSPRGPIVSDPIGSTIEELTRPLVRAVVALRGALYSHLSPPQEDENSTRIRTEPGFLETIRIVVGKKP